MTPAEHYAKGEELLARAEAGSPVFGLADAPAAITAALAHFVAAIGGEMGVPVTLPTSPPQQQPELPDMPSAVPSA